MDLVKYYPITSFLLQEDHYEETINNENHFILTKYNKYSNMETIEYAMRQYRKKLNDELHGSPAITCNCKGLGIIRNNKLYKDLRKEVHFSRGKIHKEDGPAYTLINEGYEVYLFIKNNFAQEALVINKMNLKNVFDLSYLNPEGVRSHVEGEKIYYEFKRDEVICSVDIFCELDICSYRW